MLHNISIGVITNVISLSIVGQAGYIQQVGTSTLLLNYYNTVGAGC